MPNEYVPSNEPSPASEQPAEVVQPSQEESMYGADSAASTGVAEQEAQEARQQAEHQANQQREQQARRNQENAWRRLAEKNERLEATLVDVVRKLAPPSQAPQAVAPVVQDQPPDRSQFKTWEEYEDARVDWRTQRMLAQREQAAAQQLGTLLQQQQTQQYEQQVTAQHSQRTAEFARMVPDFAEVTNREDIQVPEPAVHAIKNLPNGPAVVYAMGRDPSIVERLYSMNPVQQVAFMGQVSAALLQRPAQVSNAPAAGAPVGGRGSTSSSPPTDTEAYFAWANKRFGKR